MMEGGADMVDNRGKSWRSEDAAWLCENHPSVAFLIFGKAAKRRKPHFARKRGRPSLVLVDPATYQPPRCTTPGDIQERAASTGGRMGWVYLMRGVGTQTYKIGFTECGVFRRLAAMNGSSAVPVELIAVRPGTLFDEGCYHFRLKEFRSHGEWFVLQDGESRALVEEFAAFGTYPREILEGLPPLAFADGGVSRETRRAEGSARVETQ